MTPHIKPHILLFEWYNWYKKDFDLNDIKKLYKTFSFTTLDMWWSKIQNT